MSDSGGKGGFFNVLLMVLSLALALVAGLLILQNRDLKARLGELETAAVAEFPRLEIGDVVEAVSLPALDGTMTRLDYSVPESETLLLFFSPDCPACKRNFPNWLEIEQAPRNEDRRVVFVSTVPDEQTRQYLADKDLKGEVLIGDPKVLDSYKVSRIPTTLIVGPGGVVRRVWVGVLPDDALDELT